MPETWASLFPCGGDRKKKKKKKVEGLMKSPEKNNYVGIIKLRMSRVKKYLYNGERLNSPSKAADFIRPLFHMADREMMVVVSMNTGMEPLAIEAVAVGGMDRCDIDIRNIFKHALLNNAGNIMCFHNHLGGSRKPSGADRDVTARILEAGRIMGIVLTDHIIVTEDDYYSFKENGKLN